VLKVAGLDSVGPHGLVLETSQHIVTAFEPVLQRSSDLTDLRLEKILAKLCIKFQQYLMLVEKWFSTFGYYETQKQILTVW